MGIGKRHEDGFKFWTEKGLEGRADVSFEIRV